MYIAVLLNFSFLFRSNCHAAFSAPHRANEFKNMVLGPWAPFSAEKHLHLVVLFSCDHRLVCTIEPVSTSARPLKFSVIERVGKQSVDVATGHFYAPARC